MSGSSDLFFSRVLTFISASYDCFVMKTCALLFPYPPYTPGCGNRAEKKLRTVREFLQKRHLWALRVSAWLVMYSQPLSFRFGGIISAQFLKASGAGISDQLQTFEWLLRTVLETRENHRLQLSMFCGWWRSFDTLETPSPDIPNNTGNSVFSCSGIQTVRFFRKRTGKAYMTGIKQGGSGLFFWVL